MPLSDAERSLRGSADALQAALPSLEQAVDAVDHAQDAVANLIPGSPEEHPLREAIEHLNNAHTILTGMSSQALSAYADRIRAYLGAEGLAGGTLASSSDLETHIPSASVAPARRPTIADRHPDWPPFRTKFYFSAHGVKEDMADLGEQIAGADIVLFENVSPELAITLQSMSQGTYKYSAEEIVREATIYVYGVGQVPIAGSAWESILTAVEGSGVHIGVIETMEDQAVSEQMGSTMPLIFDGTSSYDENLEAYEGRIQFQAQHQNEREAKMPAKFEAEVDRILAEHPELQDKEGLSVVVPIGSYHTQVQELLDQASGMPSDSYTVPGAEQYDHFTTATYLASKGEPLPKELVEKVFMEQLVQNCMSVISPDLGGWGRSRYSALAASVFTSGEIESFHDKMRAGELTLELVEQTFVDHGLGRYPRTSEELRNWLEEGPLSGK
jgi:hypothetical protein